MRRRVSLLLAALLAGSTLALLGPAQPASAVIVCGGTGTTTINPGLLFPVLLGVLGQPSKDHDIDILIGRSNVIHVFSLGFTVGACVHVRNPLTIGPGIGIGSLKGYCGHSTGIGTWSGQQFAFLNLGTLVLLTGHFVGVGHVVPTPQTGSCLHVELPATVNQFNPHRLATGGVTIIQFQLAGVGLNCPNVLPITETLIRTPQTLVLVHPVGVHVDYGVHFYTTGICTNPGLLL